MTDRQPKNATAKADSKKVQTPKPAEPASEQTPHELLSARITQRGVSTSQPPPSNPGDLHTLQRTLGNRAINRLLPPRHFTPPLQARLTVGPAHDTYEQEADRVAAQVVGQLGSPTASSVDGIQRQDEPDDEALKRKPLAESIQRLATAADSMAVSPEVDSSIQSARGGGQPLAGNVRGPLENAFGADFSGVRVHTDAQADTLNRSVQARAFTTGQDIFFGSGEYKPGSRAGQELLAHELTHVVQQGGRTVRPKRDQHLSPPALTPPLQSTQAANGRLSAAPSPGATIQRLQIEKKKGKRSKSTKVELEEATPKTLKLWLYQVDRGFFDTLYTGSNSDPMAEQVLQSLCNDPGLNDHVLTKRTSTKPTEIDGAGFRTLYNTRRTQLTTPIQIQGTVGSGSLTSMGGDSGKESLKDEESTEIVEPWTLDEQVQIFASQLLAIEALIQPYYKAAYSKPKETTDEPETELTTDEPEIELTKEEKARRRIVEQKGLLIDEQGEAIGSRLSSICEHCTNDSLSYEEFLQLQRFMATWEFEFLRGIQQHGIHKCYTQLGRIIRSTVKEIGKLEAREKYLHKIVRQVWVINFDDFRGEWRKIKRAKSQVGGTSIKLTIDTLEAGIGEVMLCIPNLQKIQLCEKTFAFQLLDSVDLIKKLLGGRMRRFKVQTLLEHLLRATQALDEIKTLHSNKRITDPAWHGILHVISQLYQVSDKNMKAYVKQIEAVSRVLNAEPLMTCRGFEIEVEGSEPVDILLNIEEFNVGLAMEVESVNKENYDTAAEYMEKRYEAKKETIEKFLPLGCQMMFYIPDLNRIPPEQLEALKQKQDKFMIYGLNYDEK